MRSYILCFLLMGCGAAKEKEIEVQDGKGCRVEENESGSVVSCPDGSVSVIKNGLPGAKGSDGKPGARGSSGSSGPKGSSCTVTETESGSRISCDDGSSSEITTGASCRVEETEYGADLICGENRVPIRHGNNGAPGQPGQPGSGIGNGRRRHCTSHYSDPYWRWDIDFIETKYDAWSLFELIEVGNEAGTGRVQTRQVSVMTASLVQITATRFAATLSGDVVTFMLLGTTNTDTCRLSDDSNLSTEER